MKIEHRTAKCWTAFFFMSFTASSQGLASTNLEAKKGLAGFPAIEERREAMRAAGAMDIEKPVRISARLKNSSKGSPRQTENGIVTKKIYFQRHGQGFHNLVGMIWKEFGRDIDIHSTDPRKTPYVHPEYLDSPLTATGRQEAVSQRVNADLIEAELVVCSPLARALETAHLTFHKMNKTIPWIADERCREELGLYSCNQCRPLSQIQVDFPNVDFSSCTYGETDSLFDPNKAEPFPHQAQRVYDFLLDMGNREEESIIIVGHSAWLFCAFNCVLECEDSTLFSWFGTSEIRSVEVTYDYRGVNSDGFD